MTAWRPPYFRGLTQAICLGVMISGTIVSAQVVDVTFEANNGDISVSGRLLQITDDAYVVSTQVGAITLVPDEVTCISRACPMAEMLLNQDVPERMQRIELSSLNGTIDIEGALRGVSDGRFFIDVTGLGLVSFERRGLRCSGPGCRVTQAMIAPAIEAAPPIQVVGAPDLADALLPALLTDYVTQTGTAGELSALSDNAYLFALAGGVESYFIGTTGPSVVFTALAAGAADLAIAGRQPTQTETDEMVAAGLGDLRGTASEILLAVDGLNVVTSSDLGVTTLSIRQLADIYRGRITNWADVGGPDAQITVISRDPRSDEKAVFDAAIFNDGDLSLGRSATIAQTATDMRALLAADPNAIGYMWRGSSNDFTSLDVVGSCGMPLAQTPFAIKSNDTPLAARVYLYANAETMTDQTRAFTQYAASDLAHAVVTAQTRIAPVIEQAPLTLSRRTEPVVLEPGLQTQVAAQLINQIGNWDRISTTFRFAPTGHRLSSDASGDITRLAAYLQTLPRGTEVAIIGFAASEGAFIDLLEQSSNDARLVAQQLGQASNGTLSGLTLNAAGYGDLAPLVCDDDPKGRSINRRVEIWVRPAVE